MKKLLSLNSITTIFLITLLLITFSSTLQAQVLNGDTYNIEVHFLKGRYALNTGTTNAPISFIGKIAPLTTTVQNQLLIHSVDTPNPNASCYTYINVEGSSGFLYGPDVDLNMGVLLNSPSTSYDIEVRSWRDGNSSTTTTSPGCIFNNGDSTPQSYYDKKNSSNGYPSTWSTPLEELFSGVDRAFIRKSTYRFAKGERTAPLDFGTLANNATFIHNNANRKAPAGANVKLGYLNDWTSATHSAFKDETDVTYTFTVAEGSRTVNILTRTNYVDTYLHLVKLNEDGSFNSYIAGNNDTNTSTGIKVESSLTTEVCTGKYAIVVEGNTNYPAPITNEGNFQLVLDVSSPVYMFGGEITGDITLPFPHEVEPGVISSVQDANSEPWASHHTSRRVVSWEKNDYNSWSPAPGSTTSQTYDIPNLTKTTLYRRKIGLVCDATTVGYSNTVTVTVVNPNGIIKGRVVSRSGSGVSGIEVKAKRTSPVSGGFATNEKSTFTGLDGYYTIEGLYYGSTEAGSGASAQFEVIPYKLGHEFNFASLPRTLSQLSPSPADANFTDLTAYDITGTITQECTDCEAATECPVGGVELLVNGNYLNHKTLADGSYTINVDNPGNYTIKPRYLTHQFNPVETVVAITDALITPNINFKNTTTRTISGNLTAGCNEYVGQAVLEFREILPNDANGNPVAPCFIKRVTTNLNSGFYTITLPARKYKVQVISVSGNPASINPLSVVTFLNTLPTDSLTRDIETQNKTLNLEYVRPPVLEVVGLPIVCLKPAPNASDSYALIDQNEIRTVTVKVWQGDPANTCPALDSIVYVSSNIQKDDTNEELEITNTTGAVTFDLKGGIPNIVAPHFKTFDVQYTDRYKRSATPINLNVVVTGLKSDIGTFTTVSPEIPLKILHDPQGDNSYSFWESSSESESAVRFFRTESASASAWAEVKLGTKFETGIGVTTEYAFWGSIKESIGVDAKQSTSNESIMKLSTTQNFSTADNAEVVGTKGDVYIGAALNLKYSKTNVLTYTAPCNLTLKQDFIIAPDGFATNYVYTEGHIQNSIIPTLKDFSNQIGISAAQKAEYQNQVKVWEQIVSNNAKNKKRAAFDKNLSFDGAAGAISNTTTASSTKSSTVEFGLEINAELAAELGMEVGGSGAGAGVVVNMKVETGNSTTGATTQSTTTGYSLDDDDNGDYFSIDIKKDPVYDTPVFELVSGTSSCPWEEGTQPRDAMQLVASPTTVSGIAAGGEAEFTLQLSNISQSGETRTYSLSFDQESNPNGAEVKIGGSPVVGATQYTIGSGGQVSVIVKVKRGAASVYSYTGLTFRLSDNCDGEISKTVALNAHFNSPCSPVTLATPEQNWVNNTNTLPIVIKDYVKANLTSVTLEYAKVGTSDWADGFTRTSAQLDADAVTGTLVNWDITNITDGNYRLRLKLLCVPSNIIYSETVSGIIDRQAPQLLGIPEPTDANYVVGDEISAKFTENLKCSNLNNGNVLVKNLTTNTTINAQLGCFENGLTIVPLASLGANGDSVRVTLQNIEDAHGNVKATSDSWKFIIGTSVAATGNLALSLKPASTGLTLSQQENAAGTMDFYFSLPVNAINDVLINYSVSGSANSANDYAVSYFPTNQPNTTRFDGTSGTITIKAGQKTVILKVDPTPDTNAEPNETIIVTLLEGGDYGISTDYTLTATILNDDGEDCENGGVVYQLANNAAGNTSIAAGTYHKSLLESNGKVISPTNVTMKGTRSIVMQPGFEVRSGAIFSAQIEGCPELVATSAYSVAITDKPVVNQFQFISTVETETTAQPNVQFEPNVMTAQDSDKIYFEFTLEKEEVITLQLLDKYGAEHVKVIDNEQYNAGTFTVEIETAPLKKGDYFIRLLKADKKVYQAVKVQ